jgi:ketosteroid isomerase-like protein
MTTSRTTTDNAATVADIYAAFMRGDLPGVLDRLADDVVWDEWENNFAQRAGVPHMVERRGRDGVAAFMAVLADYTIQRFDVLDLIGSGRKVVAEVHNAFDMPSGGRYVDEQLHLWTFDDDGRVVRFRHYLDTAKHMAAAGGEDTTVR